MVRFVADPCRIDLPLLAVNFLIAAVTALIAVIIALVHADELRSSLCVSSAPCQRVAAGDWLGCPRAVSMLELGYIRHHVSLEVPTLWRSPAYTEGLRAAGFSFSGDRRRSWRDTTPDHLYTAALLAVSLLPTLLGLAGPVYSSSRLFLGVGFLLSGVRLAWSDFASARKFVCFADLSPVLCW